MKNYKPIVFATIFALLLPCLVAAKGTSGSSSSSSSSSSRSSSSSNSSSMSRGFSSNGSSKPATAPSQSQSQSSKPSFGSFGSSDAKPSAPAPTIQKSNSALSQSLEKSAAQSNALKTLDSKNTSKSATATPSDSIIGSRLGSAASTTPQYPSSSYQMPQAAPPVVYQNSGSNLNGVLTGYLVGRATSGGSNNANPTSQDIPHQSTGDIFGNSSPEAAIPSQINYGPTVKTDNSDVAGDILKAIFWLLGIGALICCGLLFWSIRTTRSSGVADETRFRRNTNYSLK